MFYKNYKILSNMELENTLGFLNLTKNHKENIRKHNWIINKNENSLEFRTICSKCSIEFLKILYREHSKGVKWEELTCNEIIIKKLLE